MSDVPSLPPPENVPIIMSPASMPLTVEIVPRRLIMHPVTGADLDAIASLGNSIHLTFFGWCGGATVAFVIVLTTVTIADPKIYAGFVGALVASSIGAIYFGIRGVSDYLTAKKTLNEIKSGRSRG